DGEVRDPAEEAEDEHRRYPHRRDDPVQAEADAVARDGEGVAVGGRHGRGNGRGATTGRGRPRFAPRPPGTVKRPGKAPSCAAGARRAQRPGSVAPDVVEQEERGGDG